MHKAVAAGLAPLGFLLLLLAAQAGVFSTTSGVAPATVVTPKIMVQPCVNTRGGLGTLAPCTASVAATTTSAVTNVTSTTVFRFQPTTNSPAPPAGQTQIVISLFTPSAAVTLNNSCVCSGSVGTGGWNCATGATVQRITCGGSNSCALNTTTGKVLDPVVFPWNTTMMSFAFDFSAVVAGWNKAGVATNNTTGSVNYSTTGGLGGSNSAVASFNTWSKNSVQEACAAGNARTASYTTNGTNAIFMVSKIVAQ